MGLRGKQGNAYYLGEKRRNEDEENIVKEEQDQKQSANFQARQPHLTDHINAETKDNKVIKTYGLDRITFFCIPESKTQ